MTINVYEKLGNRISQELQLHVEEKWLIDALEQIKEERNRLKIEAMHLESLKSKSAWQPNSTIKKNSQPNSVPLPTRVIDIDKEEKLCNTEKLNLMVSGHPALVKRIKEDNSEEQEEDEEEDEIMKDENEEMEDDDEKTEDEDEEMDRDDIDIVVDDDDDDDEEFFDDILLDIQMLMFADKRD